MRLGAHEFNIRELSGSIGDFGTLIPLSIALITINGLGFTTVFLMVGLFYLFSGLYFRLPIPVQPLKVVAAVAIASPQEVTVPVMAATGIIFGSVLLLLAFTGLIEQIARLFTRPIVRGIQLGLGLILIVKGINFIKEKDLFIQGLTNEAMIGGIPVNLIVGLIAAATALFLLNSKRFPAALVIVTAGFIIGAAYGALDNSKWELGPGDIRFYNPGLSDYATAAYLLVLPQIPLTIGNAIIGTTDTARSLFGTGKATKKASNTRFCFSMGLANIPTGFIGGMPMCHGAGGLAAHYRFGARTGGSNLLIGLILAVIALGFGTAGLALLSSIPQAILGVLLLFAGIELAILVKDIHERKDFFIVVLIAGIGLATTNLGIAFGVGILTSYLFRWWKVPF